MSKACTLISSQLVCPLILMSFSDPFKSFFGCSSLESTLWNSGNKVIYYFRGWRYAYKKWRHRKASILGSSPQPFQDSFMADSFSWTWEGAWLRRNVRDGMHRRPCLLTRCSPPAAWPGSFQATDWCHPCLRAGDHCSDSSEVLGASLGSAMQG